VLSTISERGGVVVFVLYAEDVQKIYWSLQGLGNSTNEVTFEILRIPEEKSIGVRHVQEIKRFIPRTGTDRETLRSPESLSSTVKKANGKPRVNYRTLHNYNLRSRN